jgi:hypothetical protein
MGLDVGQETVSGWTMKSNFDTAVDKVGMGGDWGRGAFGCGVGTWSYGRAHRVVTVFTRGDAMRARGPACA